MASSHPSLIAHLDLLLRARFPLLYIVSAEEEPVEEVLNYVAQQARPSRRLITWDIVRGWNDNNSDKGSVMPALSRIQKLSERNNAAPPSQESYIFLLKDLHPFLKYPHSSNSVPIIRELKNLCQTLKRERNIIILLSHTLELPAELTELTTVIDFPLPDTSEIKALITQLVTPDKLKLQGLAEEQLVRAFQGLSRNRVQRVLAKALADRQKVDEQDITRVLEEKQQAIRQTGILEFLPTQESLSNVGGLENLKNWVRTRQNAFSDEARNYGIPNPKGVLLVGIQGTGKSLSAKTIAHEWKLPLLRLDVGRLFGGLVGESESRVRQMIQVAEAMAPCILWIDEIDKAFGNISSGSDGDSGTSRRVFGNMITWMQEKKSPVFIVATANNVQILPAELLRKGRFDEIFFLNLPTPKERQDIFQVHLKRLRPTKLRDFDLQLLASESTNFSGAEIEQVIIDALHLAFGRLDNQQARKDLTTAHILQAIKETVPLAEIARDQIEALKHWAATAGARTASDDAQLLAEIRHYRPQSSPNGPLTVD